MPVPSPQLPPASATPLTPEQLESLQRVGDAYRVLRRTATAATFSGITALTLGVGSMSCVAFSPDAMGILATAVLLTVGAVELVGRQRLLAGRQNALKWLALNQLAFLTAITLYCCVQIFSFSTKSFGQDLRSAAPEADLSSIIDPQLVRRLNAWFYGLVILVSVLSQGGLAWYYARRRKYLDAFRAAEPWQRQLLQKVSR